MTSHDRILLISNSTVYGRGYLDHVEEEIRDFLGDVRTVLFFPFALYDRDGYAAKARARFAAMSYSLESVHDATNSRKAVERTDAFFIGGGNTFRLLKALQDLGLIDPIRRRVNSGIPYIGSSAGSNVAGPTIKTTKDMPIVQPRSFDALGLVPFQISPHYLDPDPSSTHMGETQEERILQFLEENQGPVLGMREGAWVRVENAVVMLKGSNGARIFRKDRAPVEVTPGTNIAELVGAVHAI
jgi:dipeptidase E